MSISTDPIALNLAAILLDAENLRHALGTYQYATDTKELDDVAAYERIATSVAKLAQHNHISYGKILDIRDTMREAQEYPNSRQQAIDENWEGV
jgi:hypothetical protein